MLSAALAINEAFSYVRGEGGASGRRRVGLSLWRPSSVQSWMTPADDEPLLQYLPSSLWLIGLGHLGQAYLWGLGLLPYANPSGLSLVLQDVDVITPSTESTSILTDASMVGQKKTRAMRADGELDQCGVTLLAGKAVGAPFVGVVAADLNPLKSIQQLILLPRVPTVEELDELEKSRA